MSSSVSPASRTELGQLCNAVRACSTASLRYAGTDPVVITRLGNTAERCDHVIPTDEAVVTKVGLSPHQRAVAEVATAYRQGRHTYQGPPTDFLDFAVRVARRLWRSPWW